MNDKELKQYHLIWLKVHPLRTEEWLRQALREGFDIHHIDGDHDNNQSENLVLIECSDHIRLHNNGKLCRLTKISNKWGIPGKSGMRKKHESHVIMWKKLIERQQRYQRFNERKCKNNKRMPKRELYDEHVAEWIFHMWEEVQYRRKFL